jgi:midasin
MACGCSKHPVLLQGPTSSGKTSLVAYLAAQTGHKLIRINNHEHTDLQV